MTITRRNINYPRQNQFNMGFLFLTTEFLSFVKAVSLNLFWLDFFMKLVAKHFTTYAIVGLSVPTLDLQLSGMD